MNKNLVIELTNDDDMTGLKEVEQSNLGIYDYIGRLKKDDSPIYQKRLRDDFKYTFIVKGWKGSGEWIGTVVLNSIYL